MRNKCWVGNISLDDLSGIALWRNRDFHCPRVCLNTPLSLTVIEPKNRLSQTKSLGFSCGYIPASDRSLHLYRSRVQYQNCNIKTALTLVVEISMNRDDYLDLTFAMPWYQEVSPNIFFSI